MKSVRILSLIMGIILILSSLGGTIVPLDWINYEKRIVIEQSEGLRECFCF